MANAIKNFHFDFPHTSLSRTKIFWTGYLITFLLQNTSLLSKEINGWMLITEDCRANTFNKQVLLINNNNYSGKRTALTSYGWKHFATTCRINSHDLKGRRSHLCVYLLYGVLRQLCLFLFFSHAVILLFDLKICPALKSFRFMMLSCLQHFEKSRQIRK